MFDGFALNSNNELPIADCYLFFNASTENLVIHHERLMIFFARYSATINNKKKNFILLTPSLNWQKSKK